MRCKKTKSHIPFDLNENLMVSAAHRYCLPRHSYIVSSCIEYLKENWERMGPNTKQAIIKDTQNAVESGNSSYETEWSEFLSWAHNMNRIDKLKEI